MMTQFEFVQAVAVMFEKTAGGQRVRNLTHVLENVVAPLVARIADKWPGNEKPEEQRAELGAEGLARLLQNRIITPGAEILRAGNCRELIRILEATIDELSERIKLHEKPATLNPRITFRYRKVPKGIAKDYEPKGGDRVQAVAGGVVDVEFTVAVANKKALTVCNNQGTPWPVESVDLIAAASVGSNAGTGARYGLYYKTVPLELLYTYSPRVGDEVQPEFTDPILKVLEVDSDGSVKLEPFDSDRPRWRDPLELHLYRPAPAQPASMAEASVDEAASLDGQGEPVDASFEMSPAAEGVAECGRDPESLLEAITGEKPEPEVASWRYKSVPEGVREDYEPYAGDRVRGVGGSGVFCVLNRNILSLELLVKSDEGADNSSGFWIAASSLELVTPARPDIEDD